MAFLRATVKSQGIKTLAAAFLRVPDRATYFFKGNHLTRQGYLTQLASVARSPSLHSGIQTSRRLYPESITQVQGRNGCVTARFFATVRATSHLKEPCQVDSPGRIEGGAHRGTLARLAPFRTSSPLWFGSGILTGFPFGVGSALGKQ